MLNSYAPACGHVIDGCDMTCFPDVMVGIFSINSWIYYNTKQVSHMLIIKEALSDFPAVPNLL